MSAVRPDQFPPERFPEFAFLGRSNVGKSSLLNALVGVKGLARTSSTPGRTQAINFFQIENKWCFADLPGYGYAKAPGRVTRTWKGLAEAYLEQRGALECCFVLLDARRGWMAPDLELKRWLEARNRRYMVIATKIDKLNQAERHRALRALEEQRVQPVPFSAVTGQGVREIWQTISKTTNP
jgi:GTP-binding protein